MTGFIERRPDRAEVVTGGNKADRPGFFVEPTVIAGLEQDDEMIQREIFGPVITVQQFSDEEQAIEWANATKYGLAASVDADVGGAARLEGARFGACGSTTTSRSSRNAARRLQGVGYSKDLSMYSLEDYAVVKHVMASLT